MKKLILIITIGLLLLSLSCSPEITTSTYSGEVIGISYSNHGMAGVLGTFVYLDSGEEIFIENQVNLEVGSSYNITVKSDGELVSLKRW